MRAKNPRTGIEDYEYPEASGEQVAGEAFRLRQMQPDWEALGPEKRARVLIAFADSVERQSASLVHALSIDTGRLAIARTEVETLLRTLRRWAARAPELFAALPQSSAPSLTPGIEIEPRFSAYSLFGAIAPWNFPVILSHIDAVPALAAGCAALVKPSEVTPRFVEPLRAILANVPELPLAYVLGGPDTGEALVASVDYICFTGSTQTGRKVAEAAARALIPANLELGGKDPLIITRTADPLDAAQVALRASVVATGQACQSIERVYVAGEIADAFLEALVQAAEAVELTAFDGSSGHLGPFIFPGHAEKVAGQLAEAVAQGARVLTGGSLERHGGGTYLRPTIVTDVTPGMALMRQETFGPVIPVTVFSDIEEAIAQANDSNYGLSAAVLAGTAEEAAAIGARLEAGAVSIQDAGLTTLVGDATNHSRRASGLGPSRMGDEGMLRFLRRQALIRQTGTPLALGAYAEGSVRP